MAACLDVVGEPWTLLIIRNAFGGTTRFEQWQDGLGLARNVLAARLKSLTAQGIFEARLYCARPRRFEYILTEKGEELRPLILHMMDWGTRHIYGPHKPSGEYIHNACGQPLTPSTHCAHCNEQVGPGGFSVRVNAKAPTLRDLARGFKEDLN